MSPVLYNSLGAGARIKTQPPDNLSQLEPPCFGSGGDAQKCCYSGVLGEALWPTPKNGIRESGFC